MDNKIDTQTTAQLESSGMRLSTLNEDEREEVSNALDMYAYHLDLRADGLERVKGRGNPKSLRERAEKLRRLSARLELWKEGE